MNVFSYRLVYRGKVEAEGVNSDFQHDNAEDFGRAYAATIDANRPPRPYPLHLLVWEGEDTSRDPDFKHRCRRHVDHVLTGVAS
ncbi:hypothetical protein ACWT_5854 [Actinoplanes sp. SE50]|uniref:hypothetical protein n=1 Tax=unclassified Actinoplanes TaxID=2626549 RepID=UPI00023EBDCA|nr:MULTISPECIES: hypothetical protein [unclassified Actinoplanes]AEV86872.1 hypothetical protein ACPL_5985 [Actinoplanes sp. SE50/110]ATO85269.1 hypothetical protein ACWT_5854 [Actinoplanes sp. SE50]SLM02679.1 hypothetical protein ACSP50_5961 [Actinoplanes sp. SE50/110]